MRSVVAVLNCSGRYRRKAQLRKGEVRRTRYHAEEIPSAVRTPVERLGGFDPYTTEVFREPSGHSHFAQRPVRHWRENIKPVPTGRDWIRSYDSQSDFKASSSAPVALDLTGILLPPAATTDIHFPPHFAIKQYCGADHVHVSHGLPLLLVTLAYTGFPTA